MLAFLELNAARFAQLMVNGLAIAGGFLLGWCLFAVIAWLLDRWLLMRKTPAPLVQSFRMMGGIAMAVLIAMIVFGHGQGWTLLGGGLDGTSNGTGAVDPAPTPPEDEVPIPITTVKRLPDSKPAEEQIRITMLGGSDVKDQRFYLFEDDPIAKNFAEIRSLIQQKKTTHPKKVAVEIRFAVQNTLPQSHPAVLMLSSWLRESAGLTVTFPAEGP